MNTPALEELPPRAQIGYVLKYGNVTHGELTPSNVVGILHAKGVLETDNIDNYRDLASEVMEHHGLD